MPIDPATANSKKSKRDWASRLDDISKREEYDLLTELIREIDPGYIPPVNDIDPERNRQNLKEMLRVAFAKNPTGVIKVTLSKPIRSIAMSCGGSNKEEFIQNAYSWLRQGLLNRYYRDAEKANSIEDFSPSETPEMAAFEAAKATLPQSNGTAKTVALSSNCIEYWDPAKGGLVSQFQGYFHRTIWGDNKCAFRTDVVHEGTPDGIRLVSLQACEAKGRMLSGDLANIEQDEVHVSSRGLAEDEENIAWERADSFESEVAQENEQEPYATDDEEDGLSEDDTAPEKPKTVETNVVGLLTNWAERNQNELCEGLSRGDRGSRLMALKKTCHAVLMRMVDPSSPVYTQDQRADAGAILEDFDSWDPKRIPVESQMPEIIAFLQKDEQVAALERQLEEAQALEKDKSGSLFLDWDAREKAGLVGGAQSSLIDIEAWKQSREAAAQQETPEEELKRINSETAYRLGVQLPGDSKHPPEEVARSLAFLWADTHLCPLPTSSPELADRIDDFRHAVKKTADKWDFVQSPHLADLLLKSIALHVTEKDDEIDLEDGREAARPMDGIAEHIALSEDRLANARANPNWAEKPLKLHPRVARQRGREY